MPLSGALQADFSDFVNESKKATAAIDQMEGEAKKLDKMLVKTGHSLDGVGGQASQLTGIMRSMAGTLGIAFGLDAVVGFGQEILQTADELTRLSDQTGLTVEQVQRLSYTAGQAGNTLEQITTAASKMQASLDTEKGQKAIEALGIEFQSFAAQKPYDQLLQVSDALRGIADPTERAQKAVELFGEAGAKILPTLVSDMRAVGEAAEVSSSQQIAALDAAGDAIDRWASAAKSAAVSTAGSILLAGEQIADQGLLQTIRAYVNSPSTALFLQQLAEMRTAATQTAEAISEAEILAQGGFGPAAGETPAERAAREREVAAAKREHEAAAKALANAEKELGEVRKGYGGLLASMSAETLKAVQADLQLGASQATVATAYGLTSQQVKAAMDQFKALQIQVTEGLGGAWASVGETVTITADHIIADINRMNEAARAYQAETDRMVDEAQQIKPPITAAKDEAKQLTVAFQEVAGAAKLTVHELLQAGLAADDAYRKAGLFVNDIGAGGTARYKSAVAAGVMLPTTGGDFTTAMQGVPGVGQRWGTGVGATSTTTNLNVNVNSTEAGAISQKLVEEMRRNGVRF